MKKILALVMALALALALAACGGDAAEENPKLAELQSAHEAAKTACAQLTAFLEEHAGQVDPELLTVCESMEAELADSDAMVAEITSGETELDDDALNELITATKSMESWAVETLAALESGADAGTQEVTAAEVLSSVTWELVGGTLGEEFWDDATYAQVLETFGGSLYYNFEMDGSVTQILGSGQAVTGTYTAQDEVQLLLDFDGSTMLAALAVAEDGSYELYISDMDYASTMILWPVEG